MKAVVILCLGMFFGVWSRVFGSDVVILDSKNFEHLTQASTGSTTGDWLVKFYAPWCGHCKSLEPIYDDVAKQLKGEVNVAKIDVTANRDLGTRFEIKGFPTIKFFSKGNLYTFKGRRSAQELIEFVRGGYQIHQPETIRGPMGMFGEILYVYEHAYKQAGKDLKAGNYFTIDIFLTFLPIIFGVIMLLLIMMPTPVPKREYMENDSDDADIDDHTQVNVHSSIPPTSKSDNARKIHGKSD